MLTTPEAPSFPPELRRAWGAEGEEEYRQLLRVTRAARGSFFLFLIESDYSPAVRDTMLDCLRDDLVADRLHLRRVTLTADCTDLFRLPDLETPADSDEAIVLVGIENTPGLVTEPGRKPERPPIFALLNRLRETLHSRLPAPFLVWCTPSVYMGLQTHAPDFFDHYAGLFQFLDAAPAAPLNRLPTSASADAHLRTAILSPAAALNAVEFYEEQVTQHPTPTLERARALLGLANALLQLQVSDYAQHVLRVLRIVEESLDLFSPERNAYDWARGQSIKGLGYSQLSTGDQAQNLQQAIACYEAALHTFTELDLPQQWARMQHNLGLAYYSLPVGDRAQNLQQAIACYEAALRVHTEADFPQEWARAQNNLGLANRNLPNGDRTQNLLRAVDCYKAALRIRTESISPRQWAMTQFNLGRAYEELGQLNAARQALRCSTDGFRKAGLETEAERAEKLLRQLKDG
jgi:tetratricopeptide (TPR) repeat protein